MQIDLDLLITWGAAVKKYKKNETIFFEEEKALFYYQVIEGKVNMTNISDEGKEYIQGIFTKGRSFGEAPLFIDEKYPCSAIAQSDSVIVKLNKASLFEILKEYPYLQMEFIKILSQRVFNKSITARELVHNKPTDKIKAFLKAYKLKANVCNNAWLVPHTRQEIANLTGLRVETVIRALKKMELANEVQIINHKLYF